MWWALIYQLIVSYSATIAWCEISRALPPLPVPDIGADSDAWLKARLANNDRDLYRSLLHFAVIVLYLLGLIMDKVFEGNYVWWSV
jgi:hypothetical protein